MSAAFKPDAGFTLVELLVALTLLSFLTVLLFGGLSFGTRAWERSRSNYASDAAVRSAQSTLANAIAKAYPLPVSSSNHRMRVDFDGEAQSMTWLSAAASGGMTRMHLGAVPDHDGLELGLSANAELAAGPAKDASPLLGDIAAFEISYFGKRMGEKVLRWAPDWRDQPLLPSLVRIRVRMQDARLVWPELIAAPRILADASCQLDALTNDCRGR